MSKWLFASVLLGLAPSSASALDLTLTCQGMSERTVANSSFGSVSGSGGYASGSFTSFQKRDGAESIMVSISADAGKVQVPRRLLPPLHTGGEDGWWPLTDVRVSDTEIRGHYTLNPFNHPEVRIDRVAGTISIDGFHQSFRGSCAAVDPNTRKF
ncbi:MAG: hypothetical protein JWP49_450 [Phenylobacterium sp.]|nr:hypothetical protein [Phenylobacterium sp.]